MERKADIYIIDDDDAVRRSLVLLLESAGLTTLTFRSAVEFFRECDELAPACIITDVRMPGLTGLELVRRLRDKGLPHPVIIITGHGDVALAVEAMKAGAVEFLEKPLDDTILLRAIEKAQNMSGALIAPEEARGRFNGLMEGLSPRENDVLHSVVSGKANKIIAYELGISPRTVEVHRANMMRKVGASNLSELVRLAILAGI